MIWQLAHGQSLSLNTPRIVGVLNVTPDSFADGGRFGDVASAVAAAQRMIHDGADMIDIGGESTRPGASRVPAPEQIRRVLPVIEAVRAATEVPLSIDTTLAPVAAAAISAGANAINDVSGGEEDPHLFTLAAKWRAGLILMHRLTGPEGDSYSDRYERAPEYGDVVDAVSRAISEQLIPRALRAGAGIEQVVIDPGLGFGKSVEDNMQLIARTGEIIAACGRPLMSGLSRKSFVGRVALGRDSTPDERLAGTLALSVLHYGAGAMLFRVHDCREHNEALRAAAATANSAEVSPKVIGD